MEKQSVFYKVKARWLVLSTFAAIIVLGIIEDLLEVPQVTGDTLSICVFVTVAGIWVVLSLRQAAGSVNEAVVPPRHRGSWRHILLLLPLVGISTVLAYPVLYALLSTDSAFVESLLASVPGTVVAGAAVHTSFRFMLMAILAPTVEELTRLVLLHRWAVKWSPRTAVVVSSILFGLVHIDVLGATVFALAMCVVYVRTQSILVPIAIHSANNIFAIVMELVSGDRFRTPELADLRANWPWMIVCAAVSTPALVWYFRRFWPDRDAWHLPLAAQAPRQ